MKNIIITTMCSLAKNVYEERFGKQIDIPNVLLIFIFFKVKSLFKESRFETS